MNQAMVLDIPALLQAVEDAGLFSATLTVQRFDGTLGASGAEARHVEANWDNLADHVDLEAMVASDIFMTRITQSSELKGDEFIAERNLKHALLNGHYPAILQGDRAVVTRGAVTKTFDITGVEDDSQENMTRLALREYNV